LLFFFLYEPDVQWLSTNSGDEPDKRVHYIRYRPPQVLLGHNSIAQVHAILSAAFKDAVKWKRMSFNPCKDVNPPHQEKQEIRFLTAEQARQLLMAAKNQQLEALTPWP
jgi:integrase